MVIINIPGTPTYDNGHQVGNPDVTMASGALANRIACWRVSDEESASDHKYIFYHLMERTAPLLVNPRYKSTHGYPKRLTAHLVKNEKSLIQELEKVSTPLQLDEITSKITEVIQQGCREAFKMKKPTAPTALPWWNTQLRATRNKLRAIKRLLKTDHPDKTRLLREHRELRAQFNKNIMTAKTTSWRTFCSNATERYGHHFRTAYSKNAIAPINLLAQDQNDHTATHRLTTLLHSIFASTSAVTSARPTRTAVPSSSILPVSLREVKRAIHTLKPNKAPGWDLIDSNILKIIAQNSPNLIKALLNTCIKLQHCPVSFKWANVCLILKQGKDPNQPGSYRPISLLPVLGKVLEKVILRRLEYYRQQVRPLNTQQHGFRPGQSTVTALSAAMQKIKHNKKQGLHTAVVSIDISAAFDTLQHAVILENLERLNTPAYITNFYASFLADRTVKLVNGNQSFPATQGCPQGSCSGPALWNACADAILSTTWPEGTSIQAFADDFLLLVGAQSRRALEARVAETLGLFHNRATQLALKINTNKCQAMVVAKSKGQLQKRPPIFQHKDWRVKTVDALKYLGVWLSSDLTWFSHLKKTRSKVLAKNSRLLRMGGKTWGIPQQLLKEWYLAVTEKIITYGAAIWYPDLNVHGRRLLISMQRPYLLQIARGYKNLSNAALHTITGVAPLDLVAAKLARQARILQLQLDDEDYSAQDYLTKNIVIHNHPAQEDIEQHFHTTSSEPELVIYTDGSKMEDTVGAAFVVYHHTDRNVPIYSWKSRLGDNNSVFQAEMLALSQAIQWLHHNCLTSARILSDSQSSLLAIQAFQDTCPQAQAIKKQLSEAIPLISLEWVKAHSGIEGNEAADTLAKEASKEPAINHSLPLPHSHLKLKLKEQLLAHWQDRWSTSDKGRDLYPYMPAVSTKVDHLGRLATEFITGHGPFPASLFRHKLAESPLCACGQEGTPHHFIMSCPITAQWHLTPEEKSQEQNTWLQNVQIMHKIRETTRFLRENIITMQD